MDYQALKTELDLPAYSGMTDQQAADALNAVNVSVQRETLTASEISDATDDADLLALSADQWKIFQMVLSGGDSIKVGPASATRARLLAMFGGGTQTRTNLVAAVTYTVSRASQLNLGKAPNAGHVKEARIR